jgi:hypothetical protein
LGKASKIGFFPHLTAGFPATIKIGLKLAKPQKSLGNGEFNALVGEIFRQTTGVSSDLLEIGSDLVWF